MVVDNAGVTNTVITGADGSYGVTNIAAGIAAVTASKAGYTSASANPSIVAGSNIQDLNLTPNTLSGQVTDSLTGLLITGATVSVTDSSNVVHTVSTDGIGHYAISALPTGPATVAASKVGYSSASSAATIVSGSNTQNEALTPNVLAGIIRDASTTLPLTGAMVIVVDNAGVTNTIITGADGSYGVTNIASGSASVTATKSGYTSASASPIIIAGFNTQDLSLTANTLTGQITDALTGLPISGANVTVTDSANAIHTTSTDGTGHYSVSDLPTGSTTVATSKTGYSSASASLSIVPGANVENESLIPTTLTGEITDATTLLPLGGATVQVVDASGTTNILTTDTNGFYGVTNLATGVATVTASEIGYTPATASLTIALGTNTQNLTLTNNSNPTLALISSVNAYISGDGALIRWQTASEVGSVSFDLFRQSAGQWVKVNTNPVLAANSIIGAAYDVPDPALKPLASAKYRIVELEERGTKREYGPFTLRAATPIPAITKSATPSVTSKSASAMSASGIKPLLHVTHVVSLTSSVNSTFVKIATTNAGVQYVTTAEAAAALGQTPSVVQQQITSGQFQLSCQGAPVSYLPDADGGGFSFYAEALKNNYTAQNIYLLKPGVNMPLASFSGPDAGAAPAGIWYQAELDLEQDLLAVPTLVQNPTQDFWMWQRLVAGLATFDTANVPFVLDHLSASGQTAHLTLRLLGGSEATHDVQVTINGVVVGQDSWNGRTPHNTMLDLPASLLVSGTNHISLKALPKGAGVTSQWYLNNLSLQYPRDYFAENGALLFGANSNAVIAVDGLSDPQSPYGTSPLLKQPVMLQNLTIAPSAMAGYSATFAAPNPLGQLVAFQTGAGTPLGRCGQRTNRRPQQSKECR